MAEEKELTWLTELPSFYCSRGLKQYYQVLYFLLLSLKFTELSLCLMLFRVGLCLLSIPSKYDQTFKLSNVVICCAGVDWIACRSSGGGQGQGARW